MLIQSMLEHVSLENTVNNMLRLVQHVMNLQEERSKEQGQASPLLRVLKELRSRVYRTINVIYSSIEHRKTDIQVYLPKLDDEVCNMLGEHYQGIQSLTAKLGGDHRMAMELHQGHDRLVNDANKALRLSKSVVMSLDDLDTEDWANTIPTAAVSETDTAGEEDPAEIDATTAADVSIGKQSAASRSPGQTPSTPATTQRLMRIVNNLHSEITEVIETIYDNIDYRRADILVCLPELGRALSGLMEDHTQHIRHVRDLASKLDDHGLVKEVEEGQVQLEDEVNEAFRLVEMFSMGEDWVEGQDAGDTTAYSYDGPVLTATAAVTVTASCNPATQAGCETDTPASQDRTETPAPRHSSITNTGRDLGQFSWASTTHFRPAG
jgi:hypothetical protein